MIRMDQQLGGVGGGHLASSKQALRVSGPRVMRTAQPQSLPRGRGRDDRIVELENGLNTLQLAVASLQQQLAELRGTMLRGQEDSDSDGGKPSAATEQQAEPGTADDADKAQDEAMGDPRSPSERSPGPKATA